MSTSINRGNRLRKKAGELEELNRRYMAAVRSMTDAEYALNDMWEGGSQEAYHDVYRRNLAQLEGFYRGIDGYVRLLRELADLCDEDAKRADEQAPL